MSALRRRKCVGRCVERSQVVAKSRRRASKPKLQPSHLVDPSLDTSRLTYLTYPEAAHHLRKTVKAVQRLREKGTIPAWCWTYIGGSLRFIREALDQLLQKKERLELARKSVGLHGPDSVNGASHVR